MEIRESHFSDEQILILITANRKPQTANRLVTLNIKPKTKNPPMFSFSELSSSFARHFESVIFPEEPASLYEPNRYFLQMGGKRVRPVLCLMGN